MMLEKINKKSFFGADALFLTKKGVKKIEKLFLPMLFKTKGSKKHNNNEC
jgi:hypothetical protein